MATKRARAAQSGRTRNVRRVPARSARRELNARREVHKALHEAEQRFQRLLNLSSDWYWEQDENLRFTLMIGGGSERSTGVPIREHLGKTRWDFPALNLTEEDWARHRALLERHQPFRDFEIRRPDRDGREHWAAVSGEPIFDSKGRFRGYRGIGRDITESKLAELRMRESEGRFRALTELSSDWYWELDTEYRFTRIEGRNVAARDQLRGSSLLGKRRWETGLEIEGGWEAHRALLDARRPFHDLLQWRVLPDGGRNYVTISGEPFYDAAGRFAGYRGVGRIVTAQKRAEHLLRLEHAIARTLAEATDVAAALQAAMRMICESESWDCAEFWQVDEAAAVMRLAGSWVAPDQPGAARFIERSRGLELKRGVGLAGSVWASAKPLWVADVLADPRVLRKDLARETGLRGALFFPIVSAGRVLGVLDFTCRELRPPDERLREAFQVIGAQIGQFLERARAEEQMLRFRLAMDESADMIVLIDRATMRFVDVNDTVCRLLGYSREEMLRMGPQDVLPLGREELARAYDEFIADPSKLSGMKSYYRCKDGTLLPFESTRRVLRSGERWIIVAISRDTSERIAAEEALRESEARFRGLTQMSSDFFWETDDLHRFALFVPGSGAPSARPVDELLGKTPWELPSLKPDQAGWDAHKAKLEGHLPFRDFEIARPVRGGAVRYLSVSGEPRFGADGSFLGYRGVGRDVTEIALARERIVSLAYSDPLTGLANRTSLAPALEQALERARRRKTMLAGMYIDLDGFKPVNDQYGHDAGDRVLIELAARLRAHLRASDPVARLGGDEFFVVLEEPADREAVRTVAHKLLAEIARPLHPAPGREATLTASIGISLFPDDAADADALMKHADRAMYEAKQRGKSRFRFFGEPAPDAQDG
jgi:diguanylate cyclase (GGDEF)-like protein/PAS domain S-box-containing protein